MTLREASPGRSALTFGSLEPSRCAFREELPATHPEYRHAAQHINAAWNLWRGVTPCACHRVPRRAQGTTEAKFQN